MATITEAVETADTGATPNATGAFTPTAGDLLVLAVACSDSVSDADDVPTASANGITFVRAIHGIKRTSLDSVDWYVANQFVPASPVSMTCSWAPTDPGTGTVIGVYKVAGMTRTGASAIRQSAKTDNAAGGGTPAITFAAACLTGNPVLAACSNGASPAAITEPGSFTETTDVGYATPATGLEVAFRNSGHTSATVTWGSTSATAFGAVGIELDTSTPDAWFSSHSATTSPKDVVVPGCSVGDRLTVVALGDGGLDSSNDVTDVTTTTQAGPGTTSAWAEWEEVLDPNGGNDWCHGASTDVTGAGDITVRVARTQTGTAHTWGFGVIRRAAAGALGANGSTAAGSTEVVNLTVPTDAWVVFGSGAWDAGTLATTFDPSAGAIELFSFRDAVENSYQYLLWKAQASGTRNYGSTNHGSTNLRCIAAVIEAGAAAPAGLPILVMAPPRPS